MANASYEEKSLFEDEDNVGLVDYSSSSEDENPAPLLKKQRLSDSGSNNSLSNGSSNFDPEEEDKMEPWWQNENVLKYTFSDCESDEDYSHYDTDSELLDSGPYSWRTADRWNQREVYCISVIGVSPREESKCLELLNVIGCEDRFLGCSVETNNLFFANLNKDEAARIKGLKDVRQVIQRRHCLYHI